MSAATFNATTTDRPLWANAEGHPSIWIRWTPAHEEWVESEQAIAYRRLGTVGRIVECGPYGKWYVGDWRPTCGVCHGTRQVELHPTAEVFSDMIMAVEGGLFYIVEALVECPACRAHPGWVVG